MTDWNCPGCTDHGYIESCLLEECAYYAEVHRVKLPESPARVIGCGGAFPPLPSGSPLSLAAPALHSLMSDYLVLDLSALA